FGIFLDKINGITINQNTGVVLGWGSPVAHPCAPGAQNHSSGVTIEMGALYEDGNQPPLSGLLCKVKVSESCTLSISVNGVRCGKTADDQAAGVVMKDSTPVVPNLTNATIQVSLGCACWGDIPSDVATNPHGAGNDYVNKPVRPQVLLARIRALLRRRGEADLPTTPPKRLEFDNLVVDSARREAWLEGSLIDLTGAEFDLLWLLASNAGRVLSREETFVALRGIEYDGQDRSIDVRISRIRPKIGDDPELPRIIKTVRSKGYLFVAPEKGK
ncbi:hypothetical protein LCGC14_0492450, partial [marine sediment metagenome]